MATEQTCMSDSVSAFLSRTGGVALLCELAPAGSRFTDLNNAIDVSNQTLDNRLEEAQHLDLITLGAVRRDGKVVHLYTPTDRGAIVMLRLHSEGTAEAYFLAKQSQRRLNAKVEETREWVETNPQELYGIADSDELLSRLQFMFTARTSDRLGE